MAVVITQTANPAGVASVGNITTYSAVSIGTASNDRIVAVLIGKEATPTITGIQLNGIDAEYSDGSTFGAMSSYVSFWKVPTGTTADAAITWSAAMTGIQNHIAVYSITGAMLPPTLSGVGSSTDMDVTAPLSLGFATTIVTGGGMIAVAVGATDTVAKAWANITEDLDVDAGDFRFTTAFSTTPGTSTITCTGTTNGEDGFLACAIFGPSVVPVILMPPYRSR